MCPVICATTKLYCGSFCLPLTTVHLMPLSVTLLRTVRVLPLLACYHCLTAVKPYPHLEVGKVTLKSNSDEALNDEFLLKSNGDEALNDGFP